MDENDHLHPQSPDDRGWWKPRGYIRMVILSLEYNISAISIIGLIGLDVPESM